jgi:TonB family protein
MVGLEFRMAFTAKGGLSAAFHIFTVPHPPYFYPFMFKLHWWLGVLCGCSALVAPGNPESAPANPDSGYVVTVDVLVRETGVIEDATVVASEDELLNPLALKIAREMDLPVREKDGKPVRYRAKLPLSLPVEGDGGAEAQAVPMPALVSSVGPQYPFEETKREIPGGVILELWIDEQGAVTQAKAVRSTRKSFERAALTAVRKWKFEPAMQDGKPIAVRRFQSIVFLVEGKEPDWHWFVAPRPCLARFVISGQRLRLN